MDRMKRLSDAVWLEGHRLTTRREGTMIMRVIAGD